MEERKKHVDGKKGKGFEGSGLPPPNFSSDLYQVQQQPSPSRSQIQVH